MASALLAAAAFTTAATSAQAVFLATPNYAETGDAGQTLGTAQAAGAFPGGASTISGTINAFADADLYSFTLSATTSLQFAVSSADGIDTSLFLFDSTGRALLANSDGSGTSFNPALSASGLAAGTYYLGISLNQNEPVNSANQLLFATGNPNDTRGPAAGTNPATLADFNGNFSFGETGAYSIALSAVPEPSTNAALAVGALVSLALVRRLRRQHAA